VLEKTRADAAAESEIDRFVECEDDKRRRYGGLSYQEELMLMWKESEIKHREQLREENRWHWIRFYDLMAQNHARIAEESRRKADALLEGGSL
jgi:hypothetical protein